MKRKVKIRLINPTTDKIAMIKIIKEFSGLGLKESKELVDTLHSYPQNSIEFDLTSQLTLDGEFSHTEKELSKRLGEIGGKFTVNGGVQYQRNKKLLELGLGTSEDYSDFISEYLFERPLSEIKKKLSNIEKEQLELIYKNLIKDDSSS